MSNTSPKFIFIAYKPSSDDYCRGCLMASYSADHEVYSDLDKEGLVERWVNYLYANMCLGCGEAGYRFWLFMDGKRVIEESHDCYCYDWEGDEYDDVEEVCGFISQLEEKAKLLAQEKYETQKRIEADKEKLRKEKIEQEEKERKRKQYEVLKKEFEQQEQV